MTTFAFEDFTFDDVRYELRRRGVLMKADRYPLSLLVVLLQNAGRSVSKSELQTQLWPGRTLSCNAISVCVSRLRKILGKSGSKCISNIYGRGYMLAAPVSTVAAHPLGSPTEHFSVERPAQAQAHVVGRTRAVETLDAAIGRAAHGDGQVCALLGEPGIGKTTLAEIVESHAAAEGFLVSRGHCSVFGDMPPLSPWLQAVRGLESALVALPGAMQPQTLPAAGIMSTPTTVDARDCNTWQQTVEWFRRTAAEITAKRPWLIVLEDLQQADVATLRLLTQLTPVVTHLPLLLVVTVRSTELPRDPARRRALDYVLGHRRCEIIELQRLSEAEVTEHIEDQLGAAESSLSSTVFAKSEGVPFFMAELLRCWRTGLSTTPSELAVSGYALDIVRQRLRTLAPETLSVLSAAAVIGCTFDLVLLSSVTQQSLQALIERVDDARSFHILAQDPDGRECFRFTHNLIRRVLYDDLSTLGRAEWHRRVFEALSEREAARDADVSAGRAYHLLEATPCVDPARAIAVARQAAKRACESGAYAEACALLRRALRVADLRTPTDPSSTGHLLSELASCERAAGEPGFEQHFARAVELARAHGSSDVLYRLCKQILGAPGSISSAVAEALLVAALATLPADDHERRAVVLSHMASMTRGGRDNDRVKALLAQAQQHAQLAGASAQRAALSAQLYFAGSPGNSAVALPMMDELEQLAADSNPRTRALRLVQPLLARAMFLMQSGDLDAAERALEVYGSEVRVLQDAELVWYYERLKLSLRLNRGEFAHARQTIVQLKWQADRLELHGAGAIFAIDTIELDRLSNELRPLSTSSLRALRADPGDHITLQTAKLRTLAQAGEHGPARAGLHALPPEELMMLPKSRDYLAQLANIALASTAVGAQAHAQVLYTLLEPYADSFVASHSLHCYGVVSHTLGLLARTLGDHPKARHFFEHAIARQRSLALPLPLARSRFQLGALLLESRLAHEREAGRDALEEVRSETTKLGIVPLRAAAEELLRYSA